MPPESAVKTPTAPIVMTASTTPYSAIVWPSCLRQCRRASSTHSDQEIIPCPPRSALGQKPRDLVERLRDAARERGEDADGADRDDGEHDAVLGHRLALLLAPVQTHELDPLRPRDHSLSSSLGPRAEAP